MKKVEPLYFGDVRLDNILLSIEKHIYETCIPHDIAYVTIIGVLERIKWRMMQEMDEDD